MDEKTAKLKVVNINDRYITKTIQFKIDPLNTSILEVNYIIVAVNGNFSSQPIRINLEDDNYHMMALLNFTKKHVLEPGMIGIIQIPLKNCNASMMQFEDSTGVDDTGRELIEFSYLVSPDGIKDSNQMLTSIEIPVEIVPAFISTFVQILVDKDIIEEKPEEEEPSDEDSEAVIENDIKEEVCEDEQQTEESH